MRFVCRIFGHSYEITDIGHGTGCTLFRCRRCPFAWVLS